MSWPPNQPARRPYPMPQSWQPMPPVLPAPNEPDGSLWVAVPWISLGFGSPLSFLYASAKARSPKLAAAGAGYGAAYATVFMTLFAGGDPWLIAVGVLLCMTLWITSGVHAFAVRREIYPRRTPRERMNQRAIHVAQYRRELRETARRLVADDPALARELCIGRPDLPRSFDDGGLIDVNHCPAPTLALLPGLTPELVNKIIEVRSRHGGFVSVEEMVVDTEMPPELVQHIGEYSVFIR